MDGGDEPDGICVEPTRAARPSSSALPEVLAARLVFDTESDQVILEVGRAAQGPPF